MNRKKITKVERQQVYEKYDGHCAYCGNQIEIKDMQVDHMIPLRLGGGDEMSNYMPACRQCNHYKRGNSLEGFRFEMVGGAEVNELRIYTNDEYRANLRKELEEDGLYECVSKRLDEIDTMTSDLLGCRRIQEMICEIRDLIEMR